MNLQIKVVRDVDGRWLAGVAELPGVLVDGQTRKEAITRVTQVARRVLAEQQEQERIVPKVVSFRLPDDDLEAAA
jgi:predicted RNase H-like HicB family nuclease